MTEWANPQVNWEEVHPVARGQFIALANDLHVAYGQGILKTLFLPFEGFRTPVRQQILFDQKKSRARPWFSAHQYGMAVDFVAKVNGRWSWIDPSINWDELRRCARARGLMNDLDWDRAHVQHPAFGELQEALWPTQSSLTA